MAARAGGLLALAFLLPATPALAQRDTDRIDITGRQNLTLGSGARAYGMGGAFLARADDATAASWNPAGLSYLRLPEVSLVGAYNSFDISRGLSTDSFHGQTVDFGAFTWPVAMGGTRGAVQLSYQRAVSFDGRRRIEIYEGGALKILDSGRSNGGFDVIALGTGLAAHPRAAGGLDREPLGERLRPDPRPHLLHVRRRAPLPRVLPRLPAAGLELQLRPDVVARRVPERGRGVQDRVLRRGGSRQDAPGLLGHARRRRVRDHERVLEQGRRARLSRVVRPRPVVAAAGHADAVRRLHRHALVEVAHLRLLRPALHGPRRHGRPGAQAGAGRLPGASVPAAERGQRLRPRSRTSRSCAPASSGC